jgi:hypothetical protein
LLSPVIQSSSSFTSDRISSIVFAFIEWAKHRLAGGAQYNHWLNGKARRKPLSVMGYRARRNPSTRDDGAERLGRWPVYKIDYNKVPDLRVGMNARPHDRAPGLLVTAGGGRNF